MPIYRVRPGYRHGARKEYGPGDMVQLTVTEAAGFADKLEYAGPDPDPVPLTPSMSLNDIEGGGVEAFRVNPDNADGGPVGSEIDPWGGLNTALVRLLRLAGYDTPEAVRATADDDLLAVKGIGAKAVALIREKVG